MSQGNLLDGVNEQADIVVANILAEDHYAFYR